MQAATHNRSSTRLLPRGYVGVWLALAFVSAGYLGVLAARPELVEHTGAALAESRPAVIGPLGSSEARALEQALIALHAEVGTLRKALGEREALEQALVARLTEVEHRLRSGGVQSISTSSLARPPPSDAGALAGERVAGHVAESGNPASSDALRTTPIILGPTEIRTERGPAAPAPTGPIGVQIATGPSADAMRLSWMALSDRHKAVLKDYEARIVQAPSGSGPAYRLVIGPVAGAPAAARLCNQLRSRRVPCGTAPFEGEPF